jgi:hypothetical protein
MHSFTGDGETCSAGVGGGELCGMSRAEHGHKLLDQRAADALRRYMKFRDGPIDEDEMVTVAALAFIMATNKDFR